MGLLTIYLKSSMFFLVHLKNYLFLKLKPKYEVGHCIMSQISYKRGLQILYEWQKKQFYAFKYKNLNVSYIYGLNFEPPLMAKRNCRTFCIEELQRLKEVTKIKTGSERAIAHKMFKDAM
jgi:hypothetical protein